MFKKHSFYPSTLIATCFGLGYFPIAPGTIGSLVGAILSIIFAFVPQMVDVPKILLVPGYALFCLFLFLIGWWSSSKYEANTGKKDASEVIIDEVAGQCITIFFIFITFAGLLSYNYDYFFPLLILSFFYLVISFILFRIFDITKPWIIKKAETKYSGGFGVMIDDVLAAIFAAITFWIIFAIVDLSGGMLLIFKTFYPSMVETYYLPPRS